MNKRPRCVLSVLSLFAAGCCSIRPVSVATERMGVCSWSWQQPLGEIAERMKAADVRGIQLALGPFVVANGGLGASDGVDALAFVKAKVAKGEWNVMSTMIDLVGEDASAFGTGRQSGDIVSDKTWETGRRLVTRGAQLTQDLGCTLMSVRVGSLDEGSTEPYKKLICRVRWMRDECGKYGVTLLLESGHETAEDLARFMSMVPGVGLDFDPANMLLFSKGSPKHALKVLYPWIKQVHVKDACAPRTPGARGTEVAWGDGEDGGKAFLAALEGLGFAGNYMIEREAGDDRPGDVAKAVERLTE